MSSDFNNADHPNLSALLPLLERSFAVPSLWSVNLDDLALRFSEGPDNTVAFKNMTTQDYDKLLQFVHRDDRTALAAAFKNAVGLQRSFETVVRFQSSTGDFHSLNVYTRVNNDIRQLVISIRDVTETMAAKNATDARMRLLEAAVEQHPELIIAVDADLNVTLWNKHAQQRFLRFREMVIGRRLHEAIPQFADKYALQFVRQALAKGSSLEIALKNEKEEVPLSLHPFNDEFGKTKGLIITLATVNASYLDSIKDLL